MSSVQLRSGIVMCHDSMPEQEQYDQVQQLKPDEPRGLLVRFFEIGDRECQKRDCVTDFQSRPTMSQISAKHKAGADHPGNAFCNVEPVVDRRKPLPVIRCVPPPRPDKDDFERFSHSTTFVLAKDSSDLRLCEPGACPAIRRSRRVQPQIQMLCGVRVV